MVVQCQEYHEHEWVKVSWLLSCLTSEGPEGFNSFNYKQSAKGPQCNQT
jgi:hypothetical protein